ncbi:MAG: diaminopimelate decarboxylase [Myxococcota bacterium]|nr:diaminopimelate decarboxylase [Myxococcota bacterium]MEC8425141.1 diaminopimelate decarboxylase [Myxococcota bacterium]
MDSSEPTPRFPIDAVAPAVAIARASGAIRDGTPAVVFHDLDRLDARIRVLRRAFPPDTLHAVAVKANPLLGVLRTAVAAGAGLEVASGGELALATAAECPPDRIVYDAPAKSRDALAHALTLGVWINADNAEELARIESLGGPRGGGVGLRVNPEVGEGRIAATSTVGAASKFGEPLHRAAELVQRFPFIRGLHVHTGSQGVGLALIEAAVARTASVARTLGLDVLDVGGGLPVRYTDADPTPPGLCAWGTALAPHAVGLRMVTEPGRVLQAGCGWAIARIEATKMVGGEPALVTTLGADMFLRRAYAPNDWDHELHVLDPDGHLRSGDPRPTTVAGPLCFSGDLLARGRPLPPAQRGDWLLIRDVGAYTVGMWSRYCSRPMPGVWGLRTSGLSCLRAPETPEDIVAFWSPPAEEPGPG